MLATTVCTLVIKRASGGFLVLDDETGEPIAVGRTPRQMGLAIRDHVERYLNIILDSEEINSTAATGVEVASESE